LVIAASHTTMHGSMNIKFKSSQHIHTSSSWLSHCSGLPYRYSLESSANALSMFISTVHKLLYLRSSPFSALTFVNVSTDTELTLQFDISRCDKKVNWLNCCQLVFEGRDLCLNICIGVLVTLRTYLDGVTAVCLLSSLVFLCQRTHWTHHNFSSLFCYTLTQVFSDWSYSQICLVLFYLPCYSLWAVLSTL